MNQKKPVIINVISGKGGTGKSLCTAVLADALAKKCGPVLVIDLDIFVRGLTALYCHQLKMDDYLANDDEFCVASVFESKKALTGDKLSDANLSEGRKPAIRTASATIEKYGVGPAYDIWPAVKELEVVFKPHDLIPDNMDQALYILDFILDSIDQEYNYILLDNRAGFDEMITAGHLRSTFSLCIDEHDEIAMLTSNMVISQLRDAQAQAEKADERKCGQKSGQKNGSVVQDRTTKKIFRIRNKCKDYTSGGVSSYAGADNYGTFVGDIPLTGDVTECFDKDYHTFEARLNRSAYKSALIDCWNEIATKMHWEQDHKLVFSGPTSDLEEPLYSLPPANRNNYIVGLFVITLSALIILFSTPITDILTFFNNFNRFFGVLFFVLGMVITITAPLNRGVIKRRYEKKKRKKGKKASQ